MRGRERERHNRQIHVDKTKQKNRDRVSDKKRQGERNMQRLETGTSNEHKTIKAKLKKGV